MARTLPPLLLAGALLLAPAVAGATPLGDLAASMEPGTFAQLEFPGVNLGDRLRTCNSGSNIGEYADSGSWDPGSRQAFFLGTSHGYCYGSRFIIYSEDLHEWRDGPLPPNPCIAPMTDACFAHAYSHNTIDPDTGMVFYRHYGNREVYRFDARGTQTWTVHTTIDTRRPTTGCCGGLEYFPAGDRGLIFVDGSEGVYYWTESRDSWELLANTALHWDDNVPTLPMASYENFAEYNPIRQEMLFGGGDSPANLHVMDASGTITSRAPAPPAVSTRSTEGWVTVDPVSGHFLVFLVDGSFYDYDSEADVWTRQMGTHPLAPRSAMEGFEIPITSYNVNMFVVWNDNDTAVWLYKHEFSEAPPPRDAGSPNPDAGANQDAGLPMSDTGTPASDTGVPTTPPGSSDPTDPSGCECSASGSNDMTLGLVMLSLFFWRRRRR